MFGFRLSFFPGGLRAGRVASGRAGGFGPGGLWAERANHLFNWRLGPVSPPVVQPVLQPVVKSSLQPTQSLVLQPVVQPSLQPKQSSVLQPLLRPTQSPVFQPVVQSSLQPKQSSFLQPVVQSPLQPTQSSVLQPVLQQPSNRRKVRSFNQSFNRRSRQSCQCTSTEVADNATRFRKNSIGNPQNLCEVTHFYT